MSTTVGLTTPDADPYRPHPAIIRAIVAEIPDVATYRVELADEGLRAAYRFEPGQFNMVYLPGVGEVAISVSGGPDEGPGVAHTIRAVGRVTRALESLEPGRAIGLRGPFGRGWPVREAIGRDVVLVAGGLGLAPLRPAVMALLADRGRYGRVTLVYGARTPADLLFWDEFDDWGHRGMDVRVTVDRADAAWRGDVGVVTMPLRRVLAEPGRSAVFTCGPEVMMRFVVAEALAAGVDGKDVYVSLERNMQCAVGLCGHCQFGPEFLCKDGPVFAYSRVARFFHQENV
ncbi:MAG TPA: FAD/NAD(P)-binding protein [Isosphaeraceae bacterium]|jgi:NAD(P)H-flavin reductase|nr:FAD/NAD(P)-binding protein [Isosphaeraceae bacterium]